MFNAENELCSKVTFLASWVDNAFKNYCYEKWFHLGQ